MSENRLQFYDPMGWPLEMVIGKPINNFIRRILWTRSIRSVPNSRRGWHRADIDRGYQEPGPGVEEDDD